MRRRADVNRPGQAAKPQTEQRPRTEVASENPAKAGKPGAGVEGAGGPQRCRRVAPEEQQVEAILLT